MKLQSKFLVLLICVLLCVCNEHKVEAATTSSENQDISGPVVIVKDQLVVTVSYGISQEARYGRYTSFTTDIYNKGKTFQGVVKATLLNNGQENVTYAVEKKLTGGEKTQVSLILPMNRYTQEINFTLENEDGKTVVEDIIPLDIKNYGDKSIIGVLSDDPIPLSYLQYYGSKVVFLSRDILSSDYLSYDLLDTIVVDHFDLDTLEADKIESLLSFIEMGGNLVLGVNEDDQSNIELLEQYRVVKIDHELSYIENDTKKIDVNLFSDLEFTKMLTSIRDYESNRNSLLKEIEENKVTFPNAGATTYIGKSMLGNRSVTDLKQQRVQKQVTQFTLGDVENVIEKDNIRLYEQVSYGKGNILVFHFCLHNRSITEEKLALYDGCSDGLFSPFYAEIAYLIKQNQSMATKIRLEQELQGESLDFRIQEISEYTEIPNMPHVSKYIVILVLYIIILGPVSFFTLFKLKKQSKLWIAIPGISILFFVIVYLAGTSTRIKAPYAGYLNIEYYDDRLPNVQGTVYAYVGLNQKSSSAIIFNRADCIKVGDNDYPSYYTSIYREKSQDNKFYDYTDAAVSVTNYDSGIKTQLYDRAAFHTELFRGAYHKKYEPLIESNLILTRDSLDGTIKNCSSSPLYNALLHLCGYCVNLGTLYPGDTVNLSDCASAYMDSIDSLLYNDNDIKKEWNIDSENISKAQIRKVDAYAYAYEQYMLKSQEPCIIASLNDVSLESPLHDVVKSEASYGESIIIEKLSLKDSIENENIIPNIDKFLKDSNVYTWYENRRYSYVNSIDFTYSIPKNDHIIELYMSDLFNNTNMEEYDVVNCGRIYMYNPSTQKYDLVFDLYSKYGAKSIKGYDLDRYVNAENQITIRYESGSTTSDGFVVPVISCRKETINATY
ncbi:MAG: hypothetical protein PUC65_06900 [Clostridiales bacterium]|nr:hypothetical protein [Clostridiales bacterium]